MPGHAFSLFILIVLTAGLARAQEPLKLNLAGKLKQLPQINLQNPQLPATKAPALLDRTKEFEDARKQNLESILHDMGIQLSQGGDVSGGGSSFQNPKEKAFLVDFLMVDLKFQETRGFAEPGQSFFPRPLNPDQVVTGIELDLRKQMPDVMGLLDERLSLWSQSSPRVTRLIQEIIQQTKWRATLLDFRNFFIRDDHYLPKEVPRVPQYQHVAPVSAVFKGYGVFILDGAWNKRLLGLTSRAGLIAHEALRSMRVDVSANLESRTIQLITAHLMLSDPKNLPQGFLDDLYLKDLWSEEDFVLKPASNASQYINALCERAVTIHAAANRFAGRLSAAEGWTDEATVQRFFELDRQARNNHESLHYIQDMPAIPQSTQWADVPSRTLTYWLNQGVDVFRFVQQKSFSLDIAPGTPTDQLKKGAWMFQKFSALEIAKRLENLGQSACDQKDEDAQKEYMMVARTMLKFMALSESVRTPLNMLQSFIPRMRASGSFEEFSFIQDVFQEAVGAQSCQVVPLEKPYLQHGEKVEHKLKCQALPKRYFPNGLPSVPRIGNANPAQ